MCLDSIHKEKMEIPTQKVKESGKPEMVGWKCFRTTGDRLIPLFISLRLFVENKWIDEYSYRSWMFTGDYRDKKIGLYDRENHEYDRYEPGFHIFLNRKDAITYTKETFGTLDNIHNRNQIQIRKVYFRDVVVTGTQYATSELDCVVAKRLFITNEEV